MSKSKSQSAPVDLSQLFGSSDLNAKSQQFLAIKNIGQQIQAGLGVKVDDVKSSEVVIMGILIDDSGSIASEGNTQIIRDGVNDVISALQKSKQEDNILAYLAFLNNGVLYPVGPLSGAPKLDKSNYNEATFRNTPLYDQAVVLLGTMIAKAQEFADNGVPTRSVTLIVTDGADVGSIDANPRDVHRIVKDMLASEAHIVAAMGIDDHGHTDFNKVFKSMGIEDKWILTPKNDQSEIRKCFQLFSKSAIKASQGTASFSKTVLGGFGASTN